MYKKYKVAIPGRDVIRIDDNYQKMLKKDNKVHLVKFAFKEEGNETVEKIKEVLNVYPETNRFIVDNHIRMYNSVLKDIPGKKYYVQNHSGNRRMISFFRKNNKVVFSFPDLDEEFMDFFMDKRIFKDVLSNVEVVIMDEFQYSELKWLMKEWDGNVILHDENYVI